MSKPRFEFRKVPPMTEAEQAAYRKAHPDKAAATDAMLEQLRKQYPEAFVAQPNVSQEANMADTQAQQPQVVVAHPVVSRNGDMFVYSSYWHTWSRVLKPMRNNPMRGNQVELDLTSHSAVHWSRVSMLNIRKHCTAPHMGDRVVAELPAEVVAEMTQWMGAALVERLLHENFMPHIDWAAYERACNGGCPFEFCSK